MYLSICPKSDLPRNTTGVLSPYRGEGGLYFPPQDWSRDAKRAVANAWLVEVRNNVDGWSQRTASCKDVGAPCGVQTNIDSQVELGKWQETGPGGLVDADILEICQLNGTINHPGLSTSQSRLHYYVWVVLPSPLILSMDITTLGRTAPDCLAMLLNDELLAVNQDPLVSGARVLRAGFSPDPPTSSDDVTFQVWGRVLAPAPAAGGVTLSRWAAALTNRSPLPLNVTLSWAELGIDAGSAALVRDAGARTDVGTFTGSWTALVPAQDALLVVLSQPQRAA